MENIKKEVCEPATPYTVNAGKRVMYVKPTVQHNPYTIEELHQMIADSKYNESKDVEHESSSIKS